MQGTLLQRVPWSLPSKWTLEVKSERMAPLARTTLPSAPIETTTTKHQRYSLTKCCCGSDIQSCVIELMGTNVSTTYITAPSDPQKTLGIKLPFLVMIIKNLKKYFTFEVQVLDDKNVRRRFRASCAVDERYRHRTDDGDEHRRSRHRASRHRHRPSHEVAICRRARGDSRGSPW